MANDWRVPGFTSTGSKRPEALFGVGETGAHLPRRITRSAGCRVWDADGREYLDYVMALGAVALGYGHPEVTRAAAAALADGVVGPLPPVLEEDLAEALARRIPWLERVATGRDGVLGCGYHGWLDWCQGGAVAGVPAEVRRLFAELPYDDPDGARGAIREVGDRLAAVVVEPLVVTAPSRDWLETVRAETTRVGAVLVFDEIKTAFRLAIGGAAERWGVLPDLVVLGKAMANGLPLAAVGGRTDLMTGVAHTWISSTLATESVALAAARATLDVFEREAVCAHLHRVGTRLLHGLHDLQHRHPSTVTGVAGVAEMCFLHFASEDLSRAVAAGCARRALLFKRTAYNFVSLAHDEATVDRTLGILEEVLAEVER